MSDTVNKETPDGKPRGIACTIANGWIEPDLHKWHRINPYHWAKYLLHVREYNKDIPLESFEITTNKDSSVTLRINFTKPDNDTGDAA